MLLQNIYNRSMNYEQETSIFKWHSWLSYLFSVVQSSQDGNMLSLMCQGNGRAHNYTMPNATYSQIRDLCTQLCTWFFFSLFFLLCTWKNLVRPCILDSCEMMDIIDHYLSFIVNGTPFQIQNFICLHWQFFIRSFLFFFEPPSS